MLPLLILVLMGGVDLARVYDAYVTITNAAREGARFGAGDPTNTSGITTRVNQEITNTGISGVTVTVSCSAYSDDSSMSCSSVFAGDRIKIAVSYPYQFITTYIFGIGQIALSNNATMAISK